jgi:hypothetical protein
MVADSSSDQRPVIPASEILTKIERGEDVEYDYKVIEGDLDLSGLDLPTEKVSRTKQELRQRLSEELKVIASEITIINSEIQGKVNFSNTHFRKTVSFREQRSFERVQFTDDVDLRGAKFDRNVTFEGVIFNWREGRGRSEKSPVFRLGMKAEPFSTIFADVESRNYFARHLSPESYSGI